LSKYKDLLNDYNELDEKYSNLVDKWNDLHHNNQGLENAYNCLKNEYAELNSEHDMLFSNYEGLKTAYGQCQNELARVRSAFNSEYLRGKYDFLESVEGKKAELEKKKAELELLELEAKIKKQRLLNEKIGDDTLSIDYKALTTEDKIKLNETIISEKHEERSRLTPKLKMKILERDSFTCQCCGKTVADGVKLEVDHRIPINKGGDSSEDNLWTLCQDCNRGKSDSIIEF